MNWRNWRRILCLAQHDFGRWRNHPAIAPAKPEDMAALHPMVNMLGRPGYAERRCRRCGLTQTRAAKARRAKA